MTRTKDEMHVTKQPWQAPTLTFQGTVGEVLQGGGGKLSLVAGDPGESRCQKGGTPGCN